MVIYPAGTAAPKYHHEGAESVIYVLDGHGTASVDQQSLPVRQHDLIHIPDRVPHSLQADGNMRFLALQVPGVFKTVWADPKKPSAWQSTDMDINGRRPAQEERERRAYNLGGGLASG